MHVPAVQNPKESGYEGSNIFVGMLLVNLSIIARVSVCSWPNVTILKQPLILYAYEDNT